MTRWLKMRSWIAFWVLCAFWLLPPHFVTPLNARKMQFWSLLYFLCILKVMKPKWLKLLCRGYMNHKKWSSITSHACSYSHSSGHWLSQVVQERWAYGGVLAHATRAPANITSIFIVAPLVVFLKAKPVLKFFLMNVSQNCHLFWEIGALTWEFCV